MRRTPPAGPSRLAAACAVLLAALAAPGCEVLRGSGDSDEAFEKEEELRRLSAEELSEQLDRFADYFAATVQSATQTVLASADDPAVGRTMLSWRLHAVRTCRTTVLGEDPQLAFLDTWVYCVQQRDFLASPSGEAALGPGRAAALAAAQEVESNLIALGRRLLSPEELERARGNVEAFADAHPLEGSFARGAVLPSASPETERGEIEWLASLPLAPFRVFSGIDEGAAAVRQFSGVAERFARRIDHLPQETVWETQLLLHDLEQRPAVQRAITGTESIAESGARLSASAESLAETARELPEEVRRQVDDAFAQLDARQERLQATIEAARGALTEAGAVVDRASSAVKDAERASGGMGQAATSLADAGRSWEGAVRAWQEMVKDVRDSGAPPDPDTPPRRPFDVTDYDRAAASIGSAAKELRAAIQDLHSLLADAGTADGARRLTDPFRAGAEDVVDHAFLRALQLSAAVAVLAVLVLRLGRRPARAA